jgi:hypothetical protein
MPQGTPERPNVGRLATKPDPAVAPFDRRPFATDNPVPLSTAVGLSLLVPTLGVMLSPALWLAATATPALAAADNPLAAIQVVAGLGLWPALFIVPARRLWQRFAGRRRVRIAGGIVPVGDRAIRGARPWRGPRNEFAASLTMCVARNRRHERLLVHIDAGKSLLLHGASTISAATIAAASALLGLPLLPAVIHHRQGLGAGRQPLLSLWRSRWANPFSWGLRRRRAAGTNRSGPSAEGGA